MAGTVSAGTQRFVARTDANGLIHVEVGGDLEDAALRNGRGGNLHVLGEPACIVVAERGERFAEVVLLAFAVDAFAASNGRGDDDLLAKFFGRIQAALLDEPGEELALVNGFEVRTQLAVDSVDAGDGDTVLVMDEGSSAALVTNLDNRSQPFIRYKTGNFFFH